jgi:hypothetical protein
MEQSQGRCGIYLRVVLGITRVQRDCLQVKTAVQVDRSHDVLQSGHDATGVVLGGSTRSRSRSSGRHPVAISGISSSWLLTVDCLGLFLRRGRGEVTGTAWEGERGRRGEGTGLLRVRRVSRERIHDDDSRGSRRSTVSQVGERSISRQNWAGDGQVNVSPYKTECGSIEKRGDGNSDLKENSK